MEALVVFGITFLLSSVASFGSHGYTGGSYISGLPMMHSYVPSCCSPPVQYSYTPVHAHVAAIQFPQPIQVVKVPMPTLAPIILPKFVLPKLPAIPKPVIHQVQMVRPVLPVPCVQMAMPASPPVKYVQMVKPVSPPIKHVQVTLPALPAVKYVQKVKPVLPPITYVQMAMPTLPPVKYVQKVKPSLPALSFVQLAMPAPAPVKYVQMVKPLVVPTEFLKCVHVESNSLHGVEDVALVERECSCEKCRLSAALKSVSLTGSQRSEGNFSHVSSETALLNDSLAFSLENEVKVSNNQNLTTDATINLDEQATPGTLTTLQPETSKCFRSTGLVEQESRDEFIDILPQVVNDEK